MIDDDENELPHPLDLPALSSKPSFRTLVSILQKLTPPPPSWSVQAKTPRSSYNYTPWLTRLVATPTPWLTDTESDTIISMASNNLALRAGRTAAPNMTRTFTVDNHDIVLFEPSWTGDSIGHKTWGASLLLARRFSTLHSFSTSAILGPTSKCKCLGLGEGTGLLGIAAVKVMSWTVTLTDLPCIIPNLKRNVDFNCSERADVLALDWMDPPPNEIIGFNSFDVVIGSDLFYDSHHPGLVVEMIRRYLKKDSESRMVIAFPLRKSHTAEIVDFEEGMAASFTIEHSGEEVGMDDWDTEIHCKWVIYRWKDKAYLNNTVVDGYS